MSLQAGGYRIDAVFGVNPVTKETLLISPTLSRRTLGPEHLQVGLCTVLTSWIMYTCVYIYRGVHICIYVYMYVFTYICMLLHMYMLKHI